MGEFPVCLGSREKEKEELCQELAQETSLRLLRWVARAHLTDEKLEDAEQRGDRSDILRLLRGRARTHAGIPFHRSVVADAS